VPAVPLVLRHLVRALLRLLAHLLGAVARLGLPLSLGALAGLGLHLLHLEVRLPRRHLLARRLLTRARLPRAIAARHAEREQDHGSHPRAESHRPPEHGARKGRTARSVSSGLGRLESLAWDRWRGARPAHRK